MILCKKCDKHKRITKISHDSKFVTLSCGHTETNTTFCRKCRQEVTVITCDDKTTMLSCNHARSKKDDKYDSFGDRYRHLIKIKARMSGLTLEEYNKRVRTKLNNILLTQR